MRSRPVLTLGIAVAAIAGLALATPSSATQLGSTCSMAGAVAFVDKPTLAPNLPLSYTLTGAFGDCLQAPTVGDVQEVQSGTFQVGGEITLDDKGTADIADDVTVTLPAAGGTGSCAAGNTAGVGVIRWADESISIVTFTAVNAGRVVAVRGAIVESWTGEPGEPGLTTNNTKYDVGDAFDGPLALDDIETADCAGTGVESATFTSQVIIGGTA